MKEKIYKLAEILKYILIFCGAIILLPLAFLDRDTKEKKEYRLEIRANIDLLHKEGEVINKFMNTGTGRYDPPILPINTTLEQANILIVSMIKIS